MWLTERNVLTASRSRTETNNGDPYMISQTIFFMERILSVGDTPYHIYNSFLYVISSVYLR